MINTYIKEVFSSVQGEGTHIGEPQIFVRFCKCNLRCNYCDTDFKKNQKTKLYSVIDLAEILLHNEIKTVSFTGGEPLCEYKFLKELFPLIKPHKIIYLETNGTMPNELAEVIRYVDVISADIKLQSVTKQDNNFGLNNKFMNIAKEKECFIKIVYDEHIEKDEIKNVVNIAKTNDLPIILQPMMIRNDFASKTQALIEIFKMFYNVYPNTRLIPQMHKFLKIM